MYYIKIIKYVNKATFINTIGSITSSKLKIGN